MSDADLIISFLKYNVSETYKILAKQQPKWWNNMVGDNPTIEEYERRCLIARFY